MRITTILGGKYDADVVLAFIAAAAESNRTDTVSITHVTEKLRNEHIENVKMRDKALADASDDADIEALEFLYSTNVQWSEDGKFPKCDAVIKITMLPSNRGTSWVDQYFFNITQGNDTVVDVADNDETRAIMKDVVQFLGVKSQTIS